MTTAVWADCVAWTDEDSRKQLRQDLAGRLWDVVYTAFHAVRAADRSADRLVFQVCRVPRDGISFKAELVLLNLIVGPGDRGEPVVTITLPDEG